MDVKRKLTYIFWFCLPLLLLLNACDDMEDKPFTSSDITGDPTETDTAELYALCEGLFNQNNSSLMRFSFNNQRMVRNYLRRSITGDWEIRLMIWQFTVARYIL